MVIKMQDSFHLVKLLTFVFLFFANQVLASTSGIVISQVYGGNGNTFNRDYVELFNASNSAVNITGWSIQYASATGTGLFSANGITSLSGTLQPGQYYLIALASSASGASLPTVDLEGVSSTNLSGTNGKVVLVNTDTGLTCNGGSVVCNATQLAQIEDLVGYGTANYFEDSAATAISSTTALFRAGGGCVDTNVNSADFSVSAPSPRYGSTILSPYSWQV